ncbi:ABC transporter substrate-binding protein [Streptococcus sobrinus]|uniref:Ferrichrome ABC transporter substrate-binding protein n=2 Tax=Streptococcus sobrinus TaxID=1310 RepID=A0ABM6W6V9_9STRE|nr:ABC transporter substrate-binding protein [Streptococcus sobrinus]AWN19502.1 ferrichrome ABC transporter substrate-binding protein [Streptococcus sobrinus]AWN21414.1 ferrichrome ABC transporter substrate-binding protein [Streptococcus sobrinus]EMP72439.1 iron complex transport system substrate-binding protein [Streptococcus sobrinus DSM 20742 = ATCC 33478]OZV22931.1 ferrichrome ABC transporter substrate-binding protein [Streptococcus sobrinus]SQG14224.1 iron complex transport system substra
MKKLMTALVALLATLVLVACNNSKDTKKEAVSSMPKISGFTYYGKVPKNPKKVVNFAYSYTGYLLELGVDVSSYSLDNEKNSPAFGDKLKNAKKLTSEDTEAIAAQKPDLIIAFSTDKNIKQLKKIAPVLVIEYGKRDYLQMLTDLGKVFDKEDKAKTWLANWKKKTAQAKQELKDYLPENATFTVMDFYDKDIYLYGKNWGRGGELIYDALGYSAPKKVQDDVFKTGYFGVSQEVLGDYMGDYALLNVSKATKNSAASLKESDVWKNISTVQNKHVLEVDEELFYFSDPMSLDKQLPAFVKAVKAAN